MLDFRGCVLYNKQADREGSEKATGFKVKLG